MIKLCVFKAYNSYSNTSTLIDARKRKNWFWSYFHVLYSGGSGWSLGITYFGKWVQSCGKWRSIISYSMSRFVGTLLLRLKSWGDRQSTYHILPWQRAFLLWVLFIYWRTFVISVLATSWWRKQRSLRSGGVNNFQRSWLEREIYSVIFYPWCKSDCWCYPWPLWCR